MNTFELIVIIIIFLIIFLVKIYNIKKLEHLTTQSDEAVQNLASLYNKDQLTIGKINVVNDANLKNATIEEAKIQNSTIQNGIIQNGTIQNGTIQNGTAKLLKMDKLQFGDKWLISATGDFYTNDTWLRFMNAAGTGYADFAANGLWATKLNGRDVADILAVKVIYPVQWGNSHFVKHIQDARYFNNDMPNGTVFQFLFVHPGNFDTNHPNRWFAYRKAIKFGKQFLLIDGPNHENVPNPENNLSNDGNWRGNI